MPLSANGLKLIEEFEGCKLTAYYDDHVPPILTIGFGHTGNVTEEETITHEQADEYLREDTAWAAECVTGWTQAIQLNQNQFDALTSLLFNIGSGNFRNSTLLKKLLNGDIQGAADQFLVWDNTNHETNQGLLNRREAERKLFLTPITDTTTTA